MLPRYNRCYDHNDNETPMMFCDILLMVGHDVGIGRLVEDGPGGCGRSNCTIYSKVESGAMQ
jgi:hypothetical protein